MFKRRNPRSYAQIVAESLWPRGGWSRAFQYVKHRVRRLPDDPHRIARGVGAGVFVSFTPLFGLHFITAVLIARLVRGNILASLLGTFFGNPLSFPLIAFVSMKLGNLILGKNFDVAEHESLFQKFGAAGRDLKDNFLALFNENTAHWDNLFAFFHDVFVPYLVGGLLPGIICGFVVYYLSAPVIGAYQKRRRKRLRERFEKLRSHLNTRLEDPNPKAPAREL